MTGPCVGKWSERAPRRQDSFVKNRNPDNQERQPSLSNCPPFFTCQLLNITNYRCQLDSLLPLLDIISWFSPSPEPDTQVS